MRATTIVAILCLTLPTGAFADSSTPWEEYLRAPSPAAAANVMAATYSVPVGDSNRFEADLPILENEVAAGEAESVKLVGRLMRQFGTSSDISETLNALLGRSVRTNPTAYLEAIADFNGCPGALPTGDLFVDRDEARAAEAKARTKALETVVRTALKPKRDKCIKLLANTQ
jgi:hypothetical protein